MNPYMSHVFFKPQTIICRSISSVFRLADRREAPVPVDAV